MRFLTMLGLLLGLTLWVLPELTAAAPGFRLLLAPQSLRSDEATLVWDKPEGAGSGFAYEVLRDGQPCGQTLKTHFTARGLAPERTHVFQVRIAPSVTDPVIVARSIPTP
jgi:hypothetical protein